MRMRIIFLLALFVPVGLWAIDADIKSARLTFTHTIDQTGDTAHVQILHVLSAYDSGVYVDSFWFEGDTTVMTFTAANLARRILIPADAEVDTSITYACSVDCGTNIYGFEWLADNDITTRAGVIDTLVDSINNVAGISDTVTAEDSVTYIKMVSRFSQRELEGNARWTMVLGDSTTEGDSIPTFSVGNLCDSLVANINGEATLADTLTAVNLADTAVQITGDRKGWTVNLFAGDTAQTVLETVAAKASWSYAYDTVGLFAMATDGYNTIEGTAILQASAYSAVGYGTLDSGWLQLWGRVGPYDGTPTGGTWTLIASDTVAGLPCTLTVAVEDTATLYGELLYLIARVADSATDTAATANHLLDYWLMRVDD